jgi:hypothetical protein
MLCAPDNALGISEADVRDHLLPILSNAQSAGAKQAPGTLLQLALERGI